MRHATALFIAVSLAAAPVAGQAPLLARADSLAAAGDTGAAVATLDQALRQNPRDAAAWHRRGVLAWAMALPRRGDGLSQSPEYIRLSRLADSSLRFAARYAPDSASYQLDLARFLLRSPDATTRRTAPGVFEKAMEVAQRSGDNFRLAEAADELGMAHWRRYLAVAHRRNLTNGVASARLQDFLGQPPQRLENFLQTSTVAYKESLGEADYAKASDFFSAALRAEPNHPRALRHAFMVLADRERWDELRSAAAARAAATPWDPQAWLARGLASHRLREETAASAAFDSAMVFLAPAERSRLMRLTRVLRPEDSARVAALSDGDRRRMERVYWELADPLLLTPGNEHWLEFLSRVAQADLLWTSETFGARGADTDLGEVFVRYGPPQEIVSLPVEGDAYDVPVVWRYPNGLWFLFALRGPSGTASFQLDGVEYARRNMRDVPVSWANVPIGRAIDSITVQASRFRAGPDSADLVLHAEIPLANMARGVDLAGGRLGLAFVALDGAAVPVARDTTWVPTPLAGADTGRVLLRAWRGRVPARTSAYRVEALLPVAARGARALAISQPPPMTGFGMSDLLVADAATPRPGRAPERWHDLIISPSVGVLRRGQPFSVVWETYELEAAAGAPATYRVELGLRPQGGTALSHLVARVVGGTTASAQAEARGKDQGLSLAFTRQVPAGPVALDYLALSLADTAPGRYRLTMTITDLATKKSVSRERELVVVK